MRIDPETNNNIYKASVVLLGVTNISRQAIVHRIDPTAATRTGGEAIRINVNK